MAIRNVAVAHILEKLRGGALTPADVVAEVRKRQTERTKIGRLALEAGLLSMRQICAIVDNQGTTKLPFGQTAVNLGFLTEVDVECILAIQVAESALSFDPSNEPTGEGTLPAIAAPPPASPVPHASVTRRAVMQEPLPTATEPKSTAVDDGLPKRSIG